MKKVLTQGRRKRKENNTFFASVEIVFSTNPVCILYNLLVKYRQDLYLPHREKKERGGKQSLLLS